MAWYYWIAIGWYLLNCLFIFFMLTRKLNGNPIPLSFLFVSLFWPLWLIYYAISDKKENNQEN